MPNAPAQRAQHLSAKLSLKIDNRPAQLEQIPAAVDEIGRQESWPSGLVFRVNLVLEELGLNIIRHAYDDRLHEIEFTVTSEPDAVTIEVADDGRPFDPLNDAPPANVTAPLGDRPLGGLGLHLVRTMMDELHYERERGRNRLTLVSRRVG